MPMPLSEKKKKAGHKKEPNNHSGQHGSDSRAPRVLFFGMHDRFSWLSLHALLQSGIEVYAIVEPASAQRHAESIPIVQLPPPKQTYSDCPSLALLVEESHIPVYEVRRLSDPLTVSTLSMYKPELICVAGFPRRIPQIVLDIPRLGCLNVHPSLLPDNRGPAPLFWVFRYGYTQTGVTIHFMNEELDAGDIITQQAIPVEVGISYEKLEGQCAELGGQLLVQCIRDVYKGHAQRVPQDEAKSSYHSYPVESDFIIPVAEWHAVRVYNFLRGVKAWGEAMKVHVNNKDIIVDGGLDFTTDDSNIPVQHIHDAFFRRSGLLWVRCKTGWAAVIPL
jgi:methionyl-tRNA formyltransferase